MSYIVLADYIARFGQEELTELLASGTATSFTAAANDATAIVDSYLESAPRKNSALPLSPVPQRIVEVTSEIARYKLFGSKATDQVKERYTEALAYLKNIASGEMVIPGSSVADDEYVGPHYVARPRVFSDENLEYF